MNQEPEQDTDYRAGEISYKTAEGDNRLGSGSVVVYPLERFANWTWINQTFLMQKKNPRQIPSKTYMQEHVFQSTWINILEDSADGQFWAQAW